MRAWRWALWLSCMSCMLPWSHAGSPLTELPWLALSSSSLRSIVAVLMLSPASD